MQKIRNIFCFDKWKQKSGCGLRATFAPTSLKLRWSKKASVGAVPGTDKSRNLVGNILKWKNLYDTIFDWTRLWESLQLLL